jgi:DNA-binding transcriptional ArsR family regulator
VASDEDIHDSLVAIHSRLGLIDGKATLTVRANRGPIIAALRELVTEKPLVGQIYLLLDGKRSQRDIRDDLAQRGVDVHEATVSRHIDKAVDHGIAELLEDSRKRGKIYRKDANMEKILGLSKNVRKWLAEQDKIVPEEAKGKRKRKRAGD